MRGYDKEGGVGGSDKDKGIRDSDKEGVMSGRDNEKGIR